MVSKCKNDEGLRISHQGNKVEEGNIALASEEEFQDDLCLPIIQCLPSLCIPIAMSAGPAHWAQTQDKQTTCYG